VQLVEQLKLERDGAHARECAEPMQDEHTEARRALEEPLVRELTWADTSESRDHG
jgi:hypothetical protein